MQTKLSLIPEDVLFSSNCFFTEVIQLLVKDPSETSFRGDDHIRVCLRPDFQTFKNLMLYLNAMLSSRVPTQLVDNHQSPVMDPVVWYGLWPMCCHFFWERQGQLTVKAMQ